MNPTGKAVAERNTERRKLFLRRCSGILALVIFYVSSAGPIIRMTQYKAPNGRYKLPGWVLIVYYPLFASPPGIGNFLEEYIKIWLPEE
jgi:hypothetical protein